MPRIVSVAGGVVGAVALTAIALATAPVANADQALNGSAFGVKVKLAVAGNDVVKRDPMPAVTYPSGGAESSLTLDSRQVYDRSDGVVVAKVLNAASNADNGVLSSRASALDLAVALQNPPEFADQFKGAMLLTASVATATCAAGPKGVTAQSQLAEVAVGGLAKRGGQTIVEGSENRTVAVAPNTTIPIEGVGKVVLNEQISSKTGVTVNAIHVYLDPELKLLHGDIIVSQARCYLGTGAQPSPSQSQPSGSPSPSDSASPGGSATPTPDDSQTAPGGGGGDGQLPVSGYKVGLVAGLGISLLVAGGAAVWLARRRRAQTDANPVP